MGILDRFFSRPSAPAGTGSGALPDNSALVAAMVKLGKKDTDKNRRALHASLVQSTLIVATTEEFGRPPAKKKAKKKIAKKSKKKSKAKNAAPETDAGEGTSLKIVKDEKGETVLPVFTDDKSFLAWYPQGSPFIALPAKEVFALILQHDLAKIAINPAGPVWGVLSQADIQRLVLANGG